MRKAITINKANEQEMGEQRKREREREREIMISLSGRTLCKSNNAARKIIVISSITRMGT